MSKQARVAEAYKNDDFIDIPVVEITDGWTVDDIDSLDDCDDAHAYLTGAICSIEEQIGEAAVLRNRDKEWLARAKSALRWKKAALQIVQTKRGKFSRARDDAKKAENIRQSNDHNQRIVDRLRELQPETLAQIVAEMKEAGDAEA